MYWIYKCNSQKGSLLGNWDYVFADEMTKKWGSLKIRPELAAAKKGHMIIACQSNLNELVGLAKVTGLRNGHELMLKRGAYGMESVWGQT